MTTQAAVRTRRSQATMNRRLPVECDLYDMRRTHDAARASFTASVARVEPAITIAADGPRYARSFLPFRTAAPPCARAACKAARNAWLVVS